MFKRPLVTWLLLLVGISAVALWWFQGPIAMEVARRVATHKMNANAIRDLPDGLHVGLCGAAPPFPTTYALALALWWWRASASWCLTQEPRVPVKLGAWAFGWVTSKPCS